MIRDVFNWLAAKPSSQYTLGGDEHSFKLNRAGRAVERIVAVPPMVLGALAMMISLPTALVAPPAAVVLFGYGAASLAFGKVAGLVKGGITHLLAKGASGLVNYVTRDKQPQAVPAPA